VAFAIHPLLGDTAGDIAVTDESGAVRIVLPGLVSISGVDWSPSGDEIWCTGIGEQLQNGLWGVGLDGTRREIYISPARIALQDVAPDGRVLVTIGNLRLGIIATAEDPTEQVDLSWFDGSVATDLTADGRQVLFWEGHEAENPHYASFLRDIDGSPAVRVGEGLSTQISPDRKWVLALPVAATPTPVLQPVGLGEPRPIPVPGIEGIAWVGFFPDGANMLVVGSTPERPRRPYVMPLAGGAPSLLWDQAIEINRNAGIPISPDGDRVALCFVSGECVVYSRRTNTATPIPNVASNEEPVGFDTTGQQIHLARAVEGGYDVDRVVVATGERAPLRSIRTPDRTAIVYVGRPILTADGSRHVFSYYRNHSDLYLVEGLE
jgi:hypothetical protein